jgi:hypothetical protein
MKISLNQPFIFWMEWLGTIILLAGVGLASFNVYPYYIFLSFFGNGAWLIVGFMWRKWSLVTVQVIISMIYIGGMVKYFLG